MPMMCGRKVTVFGSPALLLAYYVAPGKSSVLLRDRFPHLQMEESWSTAVLGVSSSVSVRNLHSNVPGGPGFLCDQ